MLNLYSILSAAFCMIVVISNIISAKMVQLPYLHDFIIPAGLVTYPLTFLLSDLVTEVFGPKKAKMMVYTALGLNILSLGIIQLALLLPEPNGEKSAAFQTVLGLSGLRIFSSLTAYIVSQVVDIQLYALIKQWTGARFLWLRNNASTCISQIIDTVIVDILFLYWGLGMPMSQVLPIMLFSFAYKGFFSVANTPLFYLCVYLTTTQWKMPRISAIISKGAIYEAKM